MFFCKPINFNQLKVECILIRFIKTKSVFSRVLPSNKEKWKIAKIIDLLYRYRKNYRNSKICCNFCVGENTRSVIVLVAVKQIKKTVKDNNLYASIISAFKWYFTRNKNIALHWMHKFSSSFSFLFKYFKRFHESKASYLIVLDKFKCKSFASLP